MNLENLLTPQTGRSEFVWRLAIYENESNASSAQLVFFAASIAAANASPRTLADRMQTTNSNKMTIR